MSRVYKKQTHGHRHSFVSHATALAGDRRVRQIVMHRLVEGEAHKHLHIEGSHTHGLHGCRKPLATCHHTLWIRQLDDLNRLAAMVHCLAQRCHIPPTEAMGINLALEEMVANVLSYAHPKSKKHSPSLLWMCRQGRHLTFVLVDDGIPFDPTTAPAADISLPLEQRSIGGLGIHLTRQLTDSLHYRREGSFNMLTMTKTI